MKQTKKRNSSRRWIAFLSTATCLAPFGYGQVTFQFDYSYDTGGFFTDASHRALLEAAGLAVSSRLGDTLSAITPSTGNTWTASFYRPDTGNSTSLLDLTIPSNTILIYAGGRALGTGVLGEGGAGGFSGSGTSDWGATVSRRGSTGETLGESATDFAPWGGSITFGTGISWYFDSDPTTVESFSTQSDFYSVAAHELAHVLGFGGADSWKYGIDKISGTTFTGSASTLLYGTAVPLSSDKGHWNNSTMSYVGTPSNPQEAAMDPDLTQGTRKYFTELDFAGLSDIGWQVSPVPEPAEIAAVVGFGLIGFATYRRRFSRVG